MLPTLRQLHYLKLLAEHGSFSRAAEAANVTQPTLSAGVQELEKILGAPVVDRARSGVILTAVGEEAVRRAGLILAQAEDLLQAAKTAGQPLTGRFRLGVIPTIAPFLLPKALTGVRARYPNLKLFLREDRTPALLAALKAGALDAAVIALPYDTSGLETARIGDDELLAALPANHALVGAGPISPDSLEGEDLILLEDGHCLRDHALGACGFDASRAGADGGFAATSLATLVQMVGAGLGVSFLPAMAVEAGLVDQIPITIRHLDTARPNREIVICWRAGSSRGPEGRLLAEVFQGV
jgi:LysR family hydrogen peroxide-inducible transcriptional activator